MLTEGSDFIQYTQNRGTSPQNTLIGVAVVAGGIGYAIVALVYKLRAQPMQAK